MGDDYADVKSIVGEAVEVADAYGRLHPQIFQEVWEKLRNKASGRGGN